MEKLTEEVVSEGRTLFQRMEKIVVICKEEIGKNTNGVGNVDFRYTDADGVLLLLLFFVIIYPCRCILTKKKCGCSYWQIKVRVL